MSANTDASIGHGFTLERSTDGGTTYTKITELRGINPPGFTVDEIERTTTESPQKTREYIPGMVTIDSIEATVTLTPALVQLLPALRSLSDYRINHPDFGIWTFCAFASAGGFETPTEGLGEASLTLKPSGPVTYAAPAAPAQGGST